MARKRTRDPQAATKALAALERLGGHGTAAQVASIMRRDNVGTLLTGMHHRGVIVRVGRGEYALPGRNGTTNGNGTHAAPSDIDERVAAGLAGLFPQEIDISPPILRVIDAMRTAVLEVG